MFVDIRDSIQIAYDQLAKRAEAGVRLTNLVLAAGGTPRTVPIAPRVS